MTQTTTIETTQSSKKKIVVTSISLILALMSAMVIQSGAEARLAQASEKPFTTGSIEDAKPAKKHMASKPGRAVEADSQTRAQGTSDSRMSTMGTTTNVTGRPGGVTYWPILGQAYNNGYQLLTSSAANINRSPSYAGNQVITMRTNIAKYEVSNGRYYGPQIWAQPTYKVVAGPGQMARMPQAWFQNRDVGTNQYFGTIEIWWDTPGGARIAYQNISFNHAGDMRCVSSPGGSCMQTNPGLYMSFHVAGAGF